VESGVVAGRLSADRRDALEGHIHESPLTLFGDRTRNPIIVRRRLGRLECGIDIYGALEHPCISHLRDNRDSASEVLDDQFCVAHERHVMNGVGGQSCTNWYCPIGEGGRCHGALLNHQPPERLSRSKRNDRSVQAKVVIPSRLLAEAIHGFDKTSETLMSSRVGDP
jgi:hypothetical protein